MSGVLILSKDKPAYEQIMNNYCGAAHVLEDLGVTLKVDFCTAAMQVWVQTGFWYSF